MGEYAHAGSLDVEAEVETEAIEYLKSVTEKLRTEGLNARWRLRKGSPAHQLVELAQDTPQDIIAITTHGRSGLSRWVLGSITEALVRASGDPVLIIAPSQQQED